jgi:hypothetical protein
MNAFSQKFRRSLNQLSATIVFVSAGNCDFVQPADPLVRWAVYLYVLDLRSSAPALRCGVDSADPKTGLYLAARTRQQSPTNNNNSPLSTISVQYRSWYKSCSDWRQHASARECKERNPTAPRKKQDYPFTRFCAGAGLARCASRDSLPLRGVLVAKACLLRAADAKQKVVSAWDKI